VLASSGGGLDGGGLDGGGLEQVLALTSRTTVTVMPPGFTVSVQATHAPTPPPPPVRASARAPPSRLLALTVTVAL
jgi:hypothetical protein